ncbi:MAG TPA: hypothetical protein VHR72_07640 [Gemmataceae bacterium]|jgi:hypothetical protein|nr:hypothetical protein [Gemmataceae bacterium]
MNCDGMIVGAATPLQVTVQGEWLPDVDTRIPLMMVDGKCVPAPMYPWLVDVDGQTVTAPCREWHGTATATKPFGVAVFHRTQGMLRWFKERRGISKDVKSKLYRASCLTTSIKYMSVCSETTALSPFYRPQIADRHVFETGVLRRFALVESSPPVEVLFLFFASEDLKSARFCWQLRPRLAETVSDGTIREALRHRRGYLRLPSATE